MWIASRHHVLEIILSSVSRVVFGSTGGPETKLFKRFQMFWPEINQDMHASAPGEMFTDHEMKKQ